MKSSIRKTNYIAKVATNTLPIGNIIVRVIMFCMFSGSFSASLQLINDCVAPVSNIANTGNLWVLIIKYKRSCCILMLLNSG